MAKKEKPEMKFCEIEPQVAQAMEKAQDIALAAQDIAAQQFQAARVIGQIQTLKAYEDLSVAGKLKLFLDMKESKAYKGMTVPLPDGSMRTINTFEEFCEMMGCSYRKVAEDLQNLSYYGQSFMESAQAAGIGYRQLRQIRDLPGTEIEEIRAASDPAILKELLEDKFAEVKKLREESEKAKKDAEARESHYGKMQKRLTEAEIKLENITKLDVDEKAKLDRERVHEALKVLMDASLVVSANFVAFLNAYHAASSLDCLDGMTREQIDGTVTFLAQSLADDFATKLPWRIDFQNIVYPDWVKNIAEAAENTNADKDIFRKRESESSTETPAATAAKK